jgi:alpha-L-fucosidase
MQNYPMRGSWLKIDLIVTTLVALQVLNGSLKAQSQAETYVWPQDPKVLSNLTAWQGYKFGLLIHMGLYSTLGTVESWGLCPEDWVSRDGYSDYCAYAADYRSTKGRFNPVNFDPGKWAGAFKGSGAKYVIYSTKHHDGFCLFDTKYTDFKVTDKGCPFSVNPRSNVVKEVFDACRSKGLVVGAYFSKPDWTTPDFWWPYYPPKDRNPNYDITRHPERWKRYVDYTQNQLREIVTEYGKIDILWLDGCWVLPTSRITKSIAEYCQYPYDLDIDMKKVADFSRLSQPGMLIVDRWVFGEYENYLTPEQKTPEKALTVPWESCITMGNAWGWVPNDKYKSTKELIQLLVQIIAKGGNLLLGVGPDGTGEFDPVVYQRLTEMGDWLKRNGEAIYATSPVEPFQEEQVAYTKGKDGAVYAIYLPGKEETMPEQLLVKANLNGKLEVTIPTLNQRLRVKRTGDHLVISIPSDLRKRLEKEPAVVIKIKCR